jgi:hypothetical protein
MLTDLRWLSRAGVILALLAAVIPAPAADGAQDRGGYVVASAVSKEDPYFEAAEKLAAHRKGTVIPFDPANLESLHKELASLQPRYVAVVAKPDVIDTNFVRSLLMMSARLDDDPFCDFAFGYITGGSAAVAVRFVEGMIRAEKEGLPKKFINPYVTHGRCVSGKGRDAWLENAGYDVRQLGFGIGNPKLDAFIESHLRDLEGNGLIRMTGCGDPERIWLFSDQRNRDRSKHWKYDPKKVGQNPDGEMFCLEASRLKKLNLYPAVLTSGTCHCGSLRRD